MLKAINLSNGAVIGDKIQTAFSFWPRFKGLLGRQSLADGEGMLLYPCSSIHCLGMRFPIDIVFLNGEYQVLAIREKMMPGTLASCSKAQYVLELSAGEISCHQIAVGDYVIFEKFDL